MTALLPLSSLEPLIFAIDTLLRVARQLVYRYQPPGKKLNRLLRGLDLAESWAALEPSVIYNILVRSDHPELCGFSPKNPGG